jgi:uncharacterized membrane protein YqhA
VLLLLLQNAPIVVDVVKQPPATPSISYGSVLLSAVALVGVILLASLLVGVAVGGIFIFLKKRFNLWAPPTDPGHARLRI